MLATTAAVDSLPLDQLYGADETAWLEIMAELVEQGRFDEMDTIHLSEYLTDMAIRDRREVRSRLLVLLVHLLKWDHQPDKRTGSWQATILHQRVELRELLESRTLFNHANAILVDAYSDAIDVAAAETGLARTAFPAVCPYAIATLIAKS